MDAEAVAAVAEGEEVELAAAEVGARLAGEAVVATAVPREEAEVGAAARGAAGQLRPGAPQK